jgi:hypothetical protein
MTEDSMEKGPLFAVIAEKQGYDRILKMEFLTFNRLMDEIVKPYNEGESFFIDGAPITSEKLTRIKILKQKPQFEGLFHDLHWRLRCGSAEKKMYADQYDVRVDAIFREGTEDVTSQIIQAYNTEVKPKLIHYMPNRQEILGAAFAAFINAMKSLGS